MTSVVTRERPTPVTAVLAAVGRTPLWVPVTVGVLVRAVADAVVPAAGVDRYEFGVIADNVVAGRGFSYFAATPTGVVIDVAHVGTPLPSAFMPPLHTALVVASTWVGRTPEGSVGVLRLLNLVLAAALLVAVGRLVTRVASPTAARWAVLGCALYPALVYQATQVSASNTYLPVEVGLLVLAVELSRRVSVGRVVAAGLLGAALGLLRAEALVLLLGLAVWLLVAARAGFRARVGIAVTVLVIALVPTVGWLVRTSVVLERPVVTLTTTGGFNLWVGNHDGASGSQKDYAFDPPLDARLAAVPAGPDYEVRRDAVFADVAHASVVDGPGETVLRDGKKLIMMLSVDPYDDRSRSAAYLGTTALLTVAGIAGAVVWWRRRGPGRAVDAALLGGWVALSLAVPTVFFALARYRLPLEIVLVVGVAVLMDRVTDVTRDDTATEEHAS